MKEYSTRAKADILDFFRENPQKQISAADVFAGLEKRGSRLNLATVYRNLDRMTDEKVLIRYKSVDNVSATYQYAESEEGHDCYNHLHLKCKNCGRIVHLECEFMKEIAEHLMKDHGFAVSCEGSVIMGLCKECSK